MTPDDLRNHCLRRYELIANSNNYHYCLYYVYNVAKVCRLYPRTVNRHLALCFKNYLYQYSNTFAYAIRTLKKLA